MYIYVIAIRDDDPSVGVTACGHCALWARVRSNRGSQITESQIQV